MASGGASRRGFLQAVAVGAAAATTAAGRARAAVEPIRLDWSKSPDRPWAGPATWANRLQDWQVRGGRLECLRADPALPMRTVHLLTHRIAAVPAPFTLSTTVSVAEAGAMASPRAAGGILLGAGGRMDPRAAALIHHNPGPGAGWFFGVNAQGQILTRDFSIRDADRPFGPPPASAEGPMRLNVAVTPQPDRRAALVVTASDPNGTVRSRVEIGIEWPTGNVALASEPGSGPRPARFAFADLTLDGADAFEAFDGGLFGPIAATQYTVSRGILKLTAQLMPMGPDDPDRATLEVREGSSWRGLAEAMIDRPSATATFRVPDWDARREVEYRVGYAPKGSEPAWWSGTIRRDPVGKPNGLVLAGLACVEHMDGGCDRGPTYDYQSRVWFPHADVPPKVAAHRPDLLFFAGDQIYEGLPTHPVRVPGREAELDYLYKWLLWCWTYRDLTRSIPTVTLPDDHDVYHPNVWGMGGDPAAADDRPGRRGGYGMPSSWVNLVQRTQSSHLPDPVDPAPVKQGIGVLFTALVWGGVGFAIIEDRKWKSPPTLVDAPKTIDSHITQRDYDTGKADVAGAELLGERQERFLNEFADDWTDHALKAVLSQTIFCNLQISSRGELAGTLDKDLDSNGWPQSGRVRALRAIQRGRMVHIAGDQHLASLLRHGIDRHDDGPWSFCVPAVANLYPRYWNPAESPFNGRHRDGFGNMLTVHAVANPVDRPAPGQFPEPVALHKEAVGYGIVTFDVAAGTVEFAAWPRHVDPADGRPFDGWPLKIGKEDLATD